MSLFTASNGTRKPIRKKLTTTDPTTIHTGSAGKSYIEALHFTNITGSAATIDIYINDGSTSFYLYLDYSIAAKGTADSVLKLTDIPFDINNGDTLVVAAGTINAIDVLGTIIEQAPQGRG